MNPKTLNDPKRNPKVNSKKMKRYTKLWRWWIEKVDRKFKMILKAKKMILKKQRMTPIIDEWNSLLLKQTSEMIVWGNILHHHYHPLFHPLSVNYCYTISAQYNNVIITKNISYCVTNTLQLPFFSPRSTYFFWISWSSSFWMAAMLIPVISRISANVNVGSVRIALRIFV